VKRWEVVEWLLLLLEKNAAAQRAKLALFLDWFFFDPERDTLLCAEPTLLLLLHSAEKRPNITATLAEFLALMVTRYCPPLAEAMVASVTHVLNLAVAARIIPSTVAIFGKLPLPLLRLLEETFPEVLFRSTAFNEEDERALAARRATLAAAKAMAAAALLAQELAEHEGSANARAMAGSTTSPDQQAELAPKRPGTSLTAPAPASGDAWPEASLPEAEGNAGDGQPHTLLEPTEPSSATSPSGSPDVSPLLAASGQPERLEDERKDAPLWALTLHGPLVPRAVCRRVRPALRRLHPAFPWSAGSF
jgi:hypothetical protein